jgi:hypothetical protein
VFSLSVPIDNFIGAPSFPLLLLVLFSAPSEEEEDVVWTKMVADGETFLLLPPPSLEEEEGCPKAAWQTTTVVATSGRNLIGLLFGGISKPKNDGIESFFFIRCVCDLFYSEAPPRFLGEKRRIKRENARIFLVHLLFYMAFTTGNAATRTSGV